MTHYISVCHICKRLCLGNWYNHMLRKHNIDHKGRLPDLVAQFDKLTTLQSEAVNI